MSFKACKRILLVLGIIMIVISPYASCVGGLGTAMGGTTNDYLESYENQNDMLGGVMIDGQFYDSNDYSEAKSQASAMQTSSTFMVFYGILHLVEGILAIITSRKPNVGKVTSVFAIIGIIVAIGTEAPYFSLGGSFIRGALIRLALSMVMDILVFTAARKIQSIN